ncbi:hypothetical protein SCLCIDRAFT_60276, partial [Scleroderma citrinum Foug A]
ASPSSSASRIGTSDTGVTSPSTPAEPAHHLLFLNSSGEIFSAKECAKFLRSFPLRPGSGDVLLLVMGTKHADTGLDCNVVKGRAVEFVVNSLNTAGSALGIPNLFGINHWKHIETCNEYEHIHVTHYNCAHPDEIELPRYKHISQFVKAELVKIEESTKCSENDIFPLFTNANLRIIQRWVDDSSYVSVFLLERPPFMFSLLPSETEENGPNGRFGVPTVEDWQSLWVAWDFVTMRMMPCSMLYQKPIYLRHICLFYLGHIPTFLDIHLSRLLNEPHTQPEEFKYIFERGIDPNVDDPSQCHASNSKCREDHSEVPQNNEDWPTPDSVLSFRLRVRERLLRLYDDISSGRVQLTRSVARVLFMTHEHEGLHLETLLYMLIQRAGTGTIPPPDFIPPPWESLAASWNAAPRPASPTVVIEATNVTIGIGDLESEDSDPVKSLEVNGHVFGWDNESPKREVAVDAFRIEWRLVTNGEFFEFYKRTTEATDSLSVNDNARLESKLDFPASWAETESGEIQVRTLYGPVPLKIAWNWPVITTYDNLSEYAVVKGGRIPTEAELLVFRDRFLAGYEGGANMGFRNWHPVPGTTGLEHGGGKGHNGGVAEWTSTLWDSYDGFEASGRYPGFSADFFDGAHNASLGGSYAMIPRIADRRSFRNWWQRNYPFCWAGARVAYDL